MTEGEWTNGTDAGPMLRFLRDRAGYPSPRRHRILAAASCDHMLKTIGDMVAGALFQLPDSSDVWDLLNPFFTKVIRTILKDPTCSFIPRSPNPFHASAAHVDMRDFYWSLFYEPPLANHPATRAILCADRNEAEQALTLAADAVATVAGEVETARSPDHLAGSAAARSAAEQRARDGERQAQANLIRCLYGNVFRPLVLSPAVRVYQGGTVVRIARVIADERHFEDLPILADALEDAGCTDAAILSHCRSTGPHVHDCLVVEAVLRLGWVHGG